jgi:hypothetical protein
MSTRSQYLSKANACADAAQKVHDPAERLALLQVSRCFMLLAKYVADRQTMERLIAGMNSGPQRRTASTAEANPDAAVGHATTVGGAQAAALRAPGSNAKPNVGFPA